MQSESQIHTASQVNAKRFAARLAVFYGTLFGLIGTHLPFFTVWLKAIGIDAAWIGIITAAPSVTRFTILPFVTHLAEKRQALRGAMIAGAFGSAAGFAIMGMLDQPLVLFIVFTLIACVWTPMVPLTDAYALRGVARYGLNYGPLRVWGSAAFVVGALACGLLTDVIAARHVIWVIAAMAGLGAIASLGLQPLDAPKPVAVSSSGAAGLLRDPYFIAIVAAAALIQGSHAAYYTFASISWQSQGLGGTTIAALWSLGVVAEIVVFALSPRFTVAPSTLIILGGLSAALRWVISAQEPQLAAVAGFQLMHGLTYGLTQIGTMGVLVRHVPGLVMVSAQGYLTASIGIVMSSASIISGVVYARYGQLVYYGMAMMALLGVILMWLAARRFDASRKSPAQPQKDASGG